MIVSTPRHYRHNLPCTLMCFRTKVFGRMDFTILSLITIWCFYQLAFSDTSFALPRSTRTSLCSLLFAYCNILQLYLLSVRHILFFYDFYDRFDRVNFMRCVCLFLVFDFFFARCCWLVKGITLGCKNHKTPHPHPHIILIFSIFFVRVCVAVLLLWPMWLLLLGP